MAHLLGIFTPNIGTRSETFIRRHVECLLPGRTVVVARNSSDGAAVMRDWQCNDRLLDLGPFQSERLRAKAMRFAAAKVGFEPDKRAVRKFLAQHGVEVFMGEYLDLSLRWFDV